MALPDLAHEETEPRDSKSPALLEICPCGKAITVQPPQLIGGQVGQSGMLCLLVKISILILQTSQVKCNTTLYSTVYLKTHKKQQARSRQLKL